MNKGEHEHDESSEESFEYSSSEDEASRENLGVYNDQGKLVDLEPNSRKVKSKVPLIKRRGKRGNNHLYCP